MAAFRSVPQVYQDFTAKITGLEERRKLIKDAKASEVNIRVRIERCFVVVAAAVEGVAVDDGACVLSPSSS